MPSTYAVSCSTGIAVESAAPEVNSTLLLWQIHLPTMNDPGQKMPQQQANLDLENYAIRECNVLRIYMSYFVVHYLPASWEVKDGLLQGSSESTPLLQPGGVTGGAVDERHHLARNIRGRVHDDLLCLGRFMLQVNLGNSRLSAVRDELAVSAIA
jgi:hypothetical protein